MSPAQSQPTNITLTCNPAFTCPGVTVPQTVTSWPVNITPNGVVTGGAIYATGGSGSCQVTSNILNISVKLPAPTVTSVAPPTGAVAGGTAVTITGTGFVSGATVTFGGTAATGVTVVNGTTITCTTPAHAAGAVTVVVTNPDTQTGTLASGFTYV